MNLEIIYNRKALKFFRKNSSILSEDQTDRLLHKALRKIIFHEDTNINVKALQGDYSGIYRIRYRKVRILFTIKDGSIVVIDVLDIGFRGGIY